MRRSLSRPTTVLAPGIDEPNIVHWAGDLVEAYVRAGEIASARRALTALEEQAERTQGRWALGVAARCRGLLADDDGTGACFRTALEHLGAVDARFETARTQLAHGERLRRSGRRRDAREALAAATVIFETLGATPWTGVAQGALRATGGKPRRRREDADRDRLTAHELQVARVVAAGASNREAAAALFLSPKTIEFHLSNIYRKLGVRRRAELAALAVTREWL